MATFLPIWRPFLYILASISSSMSCGPSSDETTANRTSLSLVRRMLKSSFVEARTPARGDLTLTIRILKSTIMGASTGTTKMKNS